MESSLKEALDEGLVRWIDAANEAARKSCGLSGNRADFYLDAATYAELMRALSLFPGERA